ncbi:hypothetical protein [Microtetraspora malaysiensis]
MTGSGRRTARTVVRRRASARGGVDAAAGRYARSGLVAGFGRYARTCPD